MTGRQSCCHSELVEESNPINTIKGGAQLNRAKKKLSAFDIVMIVVAILAIALIIAGACLLKSCLSRSSFEDEVVIGDFICQEWGKDEIHIKDLSEEGKKKTNIVIPEKLNGRRVTVLGYYTGLAKLVKGKMSSEILEKVFILSNYLEVSSGYFDETSCPKIKKIINIGNDSHSKYYVNNNIYHIDFDSENLSKGRCRTPNVVFYYNSEGIEKDFYWMDNIDSGEKVEVIPPVPQIKGYSFHGWYKEEECINKWDFDNETIEDYNSKYKLYAKWINV